MVWVPDPGRWGTLPAESVLGVQDLPEAAARIGLLPGDPVYIRPDGMVDKDLLNFVRHRDNDEIEQRILLFPPRRDARRAVRPGLPVTLMT